MGYLNKLWLNFRLQTKLILASTFFISIGISGLAFWSANLIQQETLFNKIRLANDVTVLLGANLISLTSENDYKGIFAMATGTGKTVTLQHLAEQFSNAGVPVFLSDVKGDLSGLYESAENSCDSICTTFYIKGNTASCQANR